MKLFIPIVILVALIAFTAGISVKNSFISPFIASPETENQTASDSAAMLTSQGIDSKISGGTGAANLGKTHKQNGNTYTSVESADKVTMSGTYRMSTYNIYFSITLPKNGGPISGTLSGVCEGIITGNAEKPNQYNHSALTGTYKGTCKPIPGLSFKTNAGGEFSGTAWFGEGKAGITVINKEPYETRAYFEMFF
jgi:hypothetical protein